MAIGHIGAWGTPDFGITEKIQSIFKPKQAYASSGGSNLFGTAPASSGSVLGTETSSPVYLAPGGAPGSTYTKPAGYDTTSYSGGSTSQSSPETGMFWDAADGWKSIQAPTGPSQEEIDAQFNPILDVYNQAESNLRGQQPGLIADAESQAALARTTLGNQKGVADTQLGNQYQQTQQQRDRQTGQQRQTLQELSIANQQRFGGASSAGLGASELQGREYQKNVFGIGQQAEQAFQVINQKKNEVLQEYNLGVQKLEANLATAKNQINRQFQDKLLEINARRGETEAAKAAARMEALQQLRNAAYQLDVSKAQFASQLQQQATQNTSYLDSAASKYMSAGNQGQQAANTAGSYQASAIPSVQSGSQAPSSMLVGQIKNDDYLNAQGFMGGQNPRDFNNYGMMA